MATSVDKAFIQTYESNVRHLAQQSNVRLRNHITEVHGGSEKHNWDRLASSAAVEKTGGKLTATPVTDPVWTRRNSVPTTIHWADSYGDQDSTKMLIDPSSALTLNGGRAMGRGIDDLIIAAATAAAPNGAGGTVAYDDTNQKIGSATTVISFDLITQASEIFLKRDIDPDEEKVFVIGPTQMRKMLQLTEATSSDYANMKALADRGFIESWMGYGWIVSNRLTTTDTATALYCLAFTKKAMGMNVNQDITVKVAEDPSRSFAHIVYAEMTLGVVRVEDEHMLKVHVKNAMT